MRAAVLRAFGRPLELEELADPIPVGDEILVRVRAAGLCGTDLKIIAGALSGTSLPLVPGHEIAGEVVEDADGLRAGERVALYFYDPCGACERCLAGDESLCPNSRRLGFERDGGLAELVSVRRRNVLPFAASIPFASAAVAMDAVLTPWHALHIRGRLQRGESVVIAGAGGLGLSAVQIAHAAGARVLVIDPAPSHLAAAAAFGAEVTIDPEHSRELVDWPGGGADLALETSGTRTGFEAAAAAVRPGGRIVCCGYQRGVEYGIDSPRLVLNEIAVLGSRVGSRTDAQAALQAVERGQVRPAVAELLTLDHVNDALSLLAQGGAVGRFVIEFPS